MAPKVHTQYGIYFPEGPGYLYSGYLGEGVDGQAVKVCSLADGKLYVRKKTIAKSTDRETGIRNPELVHYETYPGAVPSQLWKRTDDPTFSDSMIFSFCNGPTLASAMKRPGFKPCTLFKWKVFDQLLDVADHLHRSPSAVAHRDAHQNNMFLHFPDNRAGLPDLFLGDFSRAKPIDPVIWIATEGSDAYKIKAENVKIIPTKIWACSDLMELRPENTPYVRSVQLITKDLEDVAKCMAFLITGMRAYDDAEADELERKCEDPDEVMSEDPCALLRNQGYDGSYPEPLFVLWSALDCMVRHMQAFQCEFYDEFPALREWVSGMAAQEAERVRLDGSEQDMSWLATDSGAFAKYWDPYNRPRLYKSENFATGQNGETAGPFRIAKVNPTTFEVVEVGDEDHCGDLPEDHN